MGDVFSARTVSADPAFRLLDDLHR